MTSGTSPNHLLRRARFNKGLSMRALAKAADVSIQTIVRYEKHGGEPRAEEAKRVADALGLKPTDIFDLPLPGDDLVEESAA